MKDAVDIRSRREPFVDHYLIERMEGAELVLHPPLRREVVLRMDQPCESTGSCYYNLCSDGERILLYYRGGSLDRNRPDDGPGTQTTNLAVSTDGVCFERPNIGLFEFGGSSRNNVVRQGYQAHNFCVFYDQNPNALPEQRFKAVGGSDKNNLLGFCSPDGICWEPIKEGPLEIAGAFDSLNVPFWDTHAGYYRIFSRYGAQWEGGGARAIQSCRSDDFLHWTSPQPHIYTDGLPLEEFYTNATVPCPGAEHILLAFPMRFLPQREKSTEGMSYPAPGVSDAVFISSRDGVRWERTFREAWLRPGPDERNWTHRCNMPAAGIVATAPDEWSMYVSEHYGWLTNRLRRLTVRPHGFASAHAGYHGGELVTRPLIFGGRRLRLNYSTSAAGSVAVEIQDKSGKPVPGFALADFEPLYGDELDTAVEWKSGGDLGKISGKPVRFRFVLADADIFALRVE